MTGRFNQELPENFHAASKKTANFKPCIITKQSIHERKVHEVNQIDISQFQNEVEINEAHVRNPNYKGKNYDPNYQQNRNKQYPTTNTPGGNYKNSDSQNNTYKPSPQGNNYNSHANNYQKNTLQDKLANVSVTLSGLVMKEQLYKIQEVLQHLAGEYAKTFNKFRPKKVEVNEATVEEVVRFSQYLKKSKEDIAEAIDIYKTLGDDTFYRPEELPGADPQDEQKQ